MSQATHQEETRPSAVNYLRVSVTDRCNLRCFYCMPPQGHERLPHPEILSYEEILTLARAAVDVGIRKVRVTGGEPLVRKGLEFLLENLLAIPGMEELGLTTNGLLLAQRAQSLYEAGLRRVNVSLDTLKPQVFQKITGFDQHARVMEGIRAAVDAGLEPVKINVVVMAGLNDGEMEDFARLTQDQPLCVRFIEFMPIGGHTPWKPERSITTPDMVARLEKRFGKLAPVDTHAPFDGPALRRKIPGSAGELGFISGLSGHTCRVCNRLRLTADGRLRPCLFDDAEWDIKQLLRSGADKQALARLIREVINEKPLHQRPVKASCQRLMATMGG